MPIQHSVLFEFGEEASSERLQEVFGQLQTLTQSVPGLTELSNGPYNQPNGLHRRFNHSFIMMFVDAESVAAYLPHVEHDRVKSLLGPLLQRQGSGVCSFDNDV